ncbi:hypothetical protein BDV98DRAFT_544371 [Pterulicium gracile]|uniref:Uncharacterized protein n=1 Tax=Pterulicium gracile TaxID=1884261 RepID=A0A5C3QPW2_9AGAR|nr:hypothetical protein BDV98DRAFT_544371 [Pterula gracilis]
MFRRALSTNTHLLRPSPRLSSSPRSITRQPLPKRAYSQSNAQESPDSEEPTSFPDPTRPDLFYHLLTPQTHHDVPSPRFGLSFLSSAPKTALSATIIGWLPAGGDVEPGLDDFKENSEFRALMHASIREALEEGADDIHINGAMQLENGWMHIHDGRNPPPVARVGDPDDIIATVLVENSKIIPETYQPGPAYRLCTADGVTTLTEGLAMRLKQRLEAHTQTENKPS